jgi:hypothetical protein
MCVSSEGGGVAQLEARGGGLETCGHGPQVGAPAFFTFYTLVFDKIIARALYVLYAGLTAF